VYRCRIDSVRALTPEVYRVTLVLPEDAGDFYPGQYLELLLPHKNCPFSIASAPRADRTLELHIRPNPADGDAEEIDAWLHSRAEHVDVDYPKGDCFLVDPPARELVLIAASTGITQANSMIEYLGSTGLAHAVSLYWGVVRAADLYLADRFDALAQREPRFRFVPVVSDPSTSPGWSGRTGLVGDAVLQDITDFTDLEVIVSGGPAMVYACHDAFVERGLPRTSIRSDVFSWAPR